jgi:branched-chain amino acid transport system ATP-binding protein
MTLEVEAIDAGYGRLGVLHGVSLTVSPGEMVAVVGANGAGKTTLLRAIDGILKPTAGSIRLHGEDITGTPTEKLAAKGLAHVPENRLVFPSLSVRDNLRLGGWSRPRQERKAQDRTEEALQMFPRLRPRLAQSAGSLSGGEQQMLAIGRALMSAPTVLILDEPSIGLAPKIVAEIMTVLGQLRTDRGIAVLLVEQNVRASFKIADRGIVMQRGRVVLEGSTAELLANNDVREVYFGGLSAG